MEEPIPPHFITLKITPFSGVEDPESHLKVFRAQMIILGGSDIVRCKMFMGIVLPGRPGSSLGGGFWANFTFLLMML